MSFPTLTLVELIDRYFRQLPAFLFGFHRSGVLAQKWRPCIVLTTEPLSGAESGRPSCVRA